MSLSIASAPEPSVHSLPADHPRRIAFMERLLSDFHEDGDTGVVNSSGVSLTIGEVKQQWDGPKDTSSVWYQGSFQVFDASKGHEAVACIGFETALFDKALPFPLPLPLPRIGTYSTMIPFWRSITYIKTSSPWSSAMNFSCEQRAFNPFTKFGNENVQRFFLATGDDSVVHSVAAALDYILTCVIEHQFSHWLSKHDLAYYYTTFPSMFPHVFVAHVEKSARPWSGAVIIQCRGVDGQLSFLGDCRRLLVRTGAPPPTVSELIISGHTNFLDASCVVGVTRSLRVDSAVTLHSVQAFLKWFPDMTDFSVTRILIEPVDFIDMVDTRPFKFARLEPVSIHRCIDDFKAHKSLMRFSIERTTEMYSGNFAMLLNEYLETRRDLPILIEADAPTVRNLQRYSSAESPAPSIVSGFFGHHLFERHTVGVIESMIGCRSALRDLYNFANSEIKW